MASVQFVLWACAPIIFTLTASTSAIVEITPKEIAVVRVGESLEILCRTNAQITGCWVTIPDEESRSLSPGNPAEDGIRYHGSGFDRGECGVHITKIRETHEGVFYCSLYPVDSNDKITANVKIVVVIPPDNPEMNLSPGSRDQHVYRIGDIIQISCIARSGHPAANMSLYLDDKRIGHSGGPSVYQPIVMDGSVTVLNISHTVNWTDNGKILRCVAHHIALDRPKESKQELQVYFAPQPRLTIERFGFVIGRPAIVNVVVQANPWPRFVWHVNGEKINEEELNESGRLRTSYPVPWGKTAWIITLTITKVQQSDILNDIVLETSNDEGSFDYRIILSTSARPSRRVHNHIMSTIVLGAGVFVVVYLVFLIVVFRLDSGRWFFAEMWAP